MAGFRNAGSGSIVRDIADVIVANRAYLSEIDGRIGDGDHGVNMAKGFGRAAERTPPEASLSGAMEILSDVLLSEIGGSMGPLYGTLFMGMSDAVEQADLIDAPGFAAMLRAGLDGVSEIGGAKVGDKTMMDALAPAIAAAEAGAAAGDDMKSVLRDIAAAAEAGRDSTLDMMARLGRSSRLGERSRGVLDPGAVSCAMILRGLCDGAAARLEDGP